MSMIMPLEEFVTISYLSYSSILKELPIKEGMVFLQLFFGNPQHNVFDLRISLLSHNHHIRVNLDYIINDIFIDRWIRSNYFFWNGCGLITTKIISEVLYHFFYYLVFFSLFLLLISSADGLSVISGSSQTSKLKTSKSIKMILLCHLLWKFLWKFHKTIFGSPLFLTLKHYCCLLFLIYHHENFSDCF